MVDLRKAFSGRRRLLCLGGAATGIEPLLDDKQWEIISARTLTEVRRIAADHAIRVVAADLSSDPESVLALTEELLFERRDIRAVAIVNPAQIETTRIRRSISSLFFDFISHPLQAESVRHTIGHAWGMAAILCCGQNGPACIETGSDHELLGRSEAMTRLRDQIERISNADAPVLIGGESGTGKELAARNIHLQSSRKEAPFVAINMAAIAENLVQTELFGNEKGAFTGADRRRIGHIESAAGGTLFLDEIGDLPLQCQGNLLRFLQEGVITRVGGSETIPIDVRVIAATHIDLEEAVADGRFREDLYYRLNVLQLEMPPLRARGSDIGYLAETLFAHFAANSRCCARGLSQHAIAVMNEHHWPGNVREMINRIQRAVVMCSGRLIQPEDLGLERRQAPRRLETLSDARGKIEKQLIRTTLLETGFNISESARLLGVSRVTLYKLMERHELGDAASDAQAPSSTQILHLVG